MSLPFAMVRHGADDVPVLLGFTSDGLAGLDVVEGRYITFEPEDVGAVFDTDPAAVYFGVELVWGGAEMERAAAEGKLVTLCTPCGPVSMPRDGRPVKTDGSPAEEFHGSYNCLPVGTVLKPQHARTRHRGPGETILESRRPARVLSRDDAVFLTRTQRAVYHAGGGQEYVYRVEPVGKVHGPFDGGWFIRIIDQYTEEVASAGGLFPVERLVQSPSKKVLAMADAYWSGKRCRSGAHGDCLGTWEYLVPEARIIEVVDPVGKNVAACKGKYRKDLPRELQEAVTIPKRASLGKKFVPVLVTPSGGPLTGFSEVRATLLKHRAEVPTLSTIVLTTVFAGLTVGTQIAVAERGFECITNLYRKLHRALPDLDEVRGCIWPLGYHHQREQLYVEAPAWAPIAQKAMRDGMRDRELRRHLFLHTDTPHGISLAKLSFTLALLGNDLVCLDVRILDRMFGKGKAYEYGKTWDAPTELALARYERVEDAFLRGNPFYDPKDPVGRARAQWISWESAGRPARPDPHHAWLDVVR